MVDQTLGRSVVTEAAVTDPAVCGSDAHKRGWAGMRWKTQQQYAKPSATRLFSKEHADNSTLTDAAEITGDRTDANVVFTKLAVC